MEICFVEWYFYLNAKTSFPTLSHATALLISGSFVCWLTIMCQRCNARVHDGDDDVTKQPAAGQMAHASYSTEQINTY